MSKSYKTKLKITSNKVRQQLKEMAGAYRKIYNTCMDLQEHRVHYVAPLCESLQEVKDNFLSFKELSQGIKELQDKYLYQQAEFQNYKRRREDETHALLKYKNEDIAEELITVVDSLERALNVNEDNLSEETKKFLVGFRMVNNNLVNIMNRFEIKEIDCLNKEFDPNFMQALMTEHKDGVEPGIVIEVLQKGYMIKDKLLRASLVKVSE